MTNEPEPPSLETPEPLRPDQGEESINRLSAILAAIAISAGGLFIVAAEISRPRAKGSTCSSRIKWQERQQEIATAVAAQNSTAALPSPDSTGQSQ